MSEFMPSTKKKETEGFKWLQNCIEKKLPNALLRSTMNKGSGASGAVADAILKYRNKEFDIEIKVIGGEIPTNIRLTHQTVTKARGKDLIIALLYNFDNPEKTDVKFFRFGSVVGKIQVEPHFIVQKRDLTQDVLGYIDALDGMLKSDPIPLNLSCLPCENKKNRWRLTIEWDEKRVFPS